MSRDVVIVVAIVAIPSHIASAATAAMAISQPTHN